MFPNFNDPFAAMTALQRALESRLESEWIGASTSGTSPMQAQATPPPEANNH